MTTQPNKETTFTTLANTCHHINDEQTLFLPYTNDTEYGLYSDLYNLLFAPPFDLKNMDGHVFQSFDTTPTPKNTTPYSFLRQHAQFCNHEYNIRSPYPPYNMIKKYGLDMKLSRYACFCLFRNIPNFVFTRTYFMMPNADFKTVYDTSYKYARIYLREQLQDSERRLNGVLKNIDANIALFRHEAFKTFYNEMYTEQIIDAYNQGKNITLADHMGAPSLYARKYAIDSAISKFDYALHKDLRSFAMIFDHELRIARSKMISKFNTTPEKDIHKQSIKSLISEYKAAEKAFIEQYAPCTLNIK